MRNYQSILILKPDLDEAQVDQSIEKITSTLKKFGGTILKLDQWGKKRLAYRVRKNKFGFYLNIYHTCEQAEISNLEKAYQLYDLIIKYLVIRLDDSDVERVMSQKEPASESSSEDKKGEEPKAVAEVKGEEKKGEEPKAVAEEKGEEKKDEEPKAVAEVKGEEKKGEEKKGEEPKAVAAEEPK